LMWPIPGATPIPKRSLLSATTRPPITGAGQSGTAPRSSSAISSMDLTTTPDPRRTKSAGSNWPPIAEIATPTKSAWPLRITITVLLAI